jgi:predicted amidophosphoribosyltransferase
MQTESEFDGDTAILVILLLFCLPAGVYYYVANKAEKVVCPSCRETADTNASVCPNCTEDLDAHRRDDSAA